MALNNSDHGAAAAVAGLVSAPLPQPRQLQQPWADFATVFTNAKAGMDSVDREHVKRVVYEMSKDSAHFKNEQRKQAHTDVRIARLKELDAKLTPPELVGHARAMDAKIMVLEASRDLSRTWLVVDMDAFYAAVEELHNPALRGVPMAVGGLGMISTANYLARKYGVRSAMPGFIGRKLCPQLVFAKPDFSKYVAAAKQTRDIFHTFDANFHSGGLDEASLDITDYCLQHNMTGAEVAEDLRRRVRQEAHLTCSCGVAPNRMLAKVCCDINKPDGQYILPSSREAVVRFVETLPIRKIPGIGKVTEQTLNALGINSCAHILQRRGALAALFSNIAVDFFLSAALGLGATRHEVATPADYADVPKRKGISCERTFRNMSDKGELEAMAQHLVEHLAADMAKEGIEGRNITLKLKASNFEVHTRAATLPSYIHTAEQMYPAVLRLLHAELPIEIRLMGVRMSTLRKCGAGSSRSPLAKWLGRAAALAASTAGSSLMDVHGDMPKQCAGTLSSGGWAGCPKGGGAAAGGGTPHARRCLGTTPADGTGRPGLGSGNEEPLRGLIEVEGDGWVPSAGCSSLPACIPGAGRHSRCASSDREGDADNWSGSSWHLEGHDEDDAALLDLDSHLDDAAACESELKGGIYYKVPGPTCDVQGVAQQQQHHQQRPQNVCVRHPTTPSMLQSVFKHDTVYTAAAAARLSSTALCVLPKTAVVAPLLTPIPAAVAAATATAASRLLPCTSTATDAAAHSAASHNPEETARPASLGLALAAGVPASPALAATELAVVVAGPTITQPLAEAGRDGGPWTCSACTFAGNHRTLLRCEVCDCLRRGGGPGQVTLSASLPNIAVSSAATRKPDTAFIGTSSNKRQLPCSATPTTAKRPTRQALLPQVLNQPQRSGSEAQGANGAKVEIEGMRERADRNIVQGVCRLCGVAVLEGGAQEHEDYHLALRISRV